MIEHVSIPVQNFDAQKTFYTKVLAPLGYKLNMEFPGAAGYMAQGHTSFWISQGPPAEKVHVAFGAPNKEAVHTFHAVGLESGGKDNGQPGPRKDYSPDYYASFITDPEGNNIEAVFFDESAA